MMIGTELFARSCRHTSKPSTSGSITSSTTRSNCPSWKRASASLPVLAGITSYPSFRSGYVRSVWTDCSSSTRRILGASLDISPVLTIESVGWSEVWVEKRDRPPALPRGVHPGVARNGGRGVLAGEPAAGRAAGSSRRRVVRGNARLLHGGRDRARRAGPPRGQTGGRENRAPGGVGVPALPVPDHRPALRRGREAADQRDRAAARPVASRDRPARLARRAVRARRDGQRGGHGGPDGGRTRDRGPGRAQDDRARVGRRRDARRRWSAPLRAVDAGPGPRGRRARAVEHGRTALARTPAGRLVERRGPRQPRAAAHG